MFPTALKQTPSLTTPRPAPPRQAPPAEPEAEPETLIQEIYISQVWNWISFYLQSDNMSLNNVLPIYH